MTSFINVTKIGGGRCYTRKIWLFHHILICHLSPHASRELVTLSRESPVMAIKPPSSKIRFLTVCRLTAHNAHHPVRTRKQTFHYKGLRDLKMTILLIILDEVTRHNSQFQPLITVFTVMMLDSLL